MNRKNKGGVLHIGGYTIVEVLMFLAVSAGLATSVMVMIGGEQNKTQFNAAVRDLELQLQDAINDVGVGVYPSSGSFTCKVGVTGEPDITAGSNTTGTNEDCIFSGKAFQFAPAAEPGKYDAYTIVGRRQVTAGGNSLEVSSIEESNPRVVSGAFGLFESKSLDAGLEFSQVLIGGTPRGGFALVSSFGQTDPSRGGVVAGYSGASLMRLDFDINKPFSDVDFAVSSLNSSNVITEPITICIQEPGGGRRAAIQITGQGTEALFEPDIPAGCP